MNSPLKIQLIFIDPFTNNFYYPHKYIYLHDVLSKKNKINKYTVLRFKTKIYLLLYLINNWKNQIAFIYK